MDRDQGMATMDEIKRRLEADFRATFCTKLAGRHDIIGERDPASLRTREMMDIADAHPELFRMH
jgi:hypothetical protein